MPNQRKAEAGDYEVELARARARARACAAQEQASEGRPWERFRDQSTAGKPWEKFQDQSEARVQSEFEVQPWYGKAGRAAMDIARLGLDGASFGFGDKLLAGIEAAGRPDMDYDDALRLHHQATGDARTRAGLAGDVAEVGAGFLPMNAAASAGLSARPASYRRGCRGRRRSGRSWWQAASRARATVRCMGPGMTRISAMPPLTSRALC